MESLLETELNQLLMKIKPGKMRLISSDIAEMLKQRNVGRISRQVDPTGTRFKERKHAGKDRGEMFRGLRHRVETESDAKGLEVGFWGLRAPRIHHHGLKQGNTEFPARQLLGLPDEDVRAVLDKLKQAISA